MLDTKLNELYQEAQRIAGNFGLHNKINENTLARFPGERWQVYCQGLAAQIQMMNNGKDPLETERNQCISSQMAKWFEGWKKWAEQEGYSLTGVS